METMSDKEKEMLKALQAKQKRIKRAEADFFSNVKKHEKEILDYLGINRTAAAQMRRLTAIAARLQLSVDVTLDGLEKMAEKKENKDSQSDNIVEVQYGRDNNDA